MTVCFAIFTYFFKFHLKLKLGIWLSTGVNPFKLQYNSEQKLAGKIYYTFTDDKYYYTISEDGVFSNKFPVDEKYR